MIQRFGDKLRYLRKQQQLTQKECADLLGLARHSHISNLESGRKTPSLELVCLMARQFDVSVDYLLRDDVAVDKPETLATHAEDTLKLQFASNLRTLRTRARLTQVELAKELGGISQWHLSHLETGSKGPSLEILLAIAGFFDVLVEDILYGNFDKNIVL